MDGWKLGYALQCDIKHGMLSSFSLKLYTENKRVSIWNKHETK